MEQKYLLDGRFVNVIQKLNSGSYLVENVYEGYDGHDGEYVDTGSPYIVDMVFDKIQTAKYNNEIKSLTESISKLNNVYREMQESIHTLEQEHKNKMEKFKKFDSLKHLEDFLDGKITHYAILGTYRPEIIKFGDTTSEYSRDKLRLLSLFGKTDGTLEWHLNKYYDGSGGNETVVPCLSEEEARQAILDYLYKYCTDNSRNKDWLPSMELIKKAKSFGAILPDELIEKVKAKTLEVLRKNESDAEKKYKEARTKRVEFKK